MNTQSDHRLNGAALSPLIINLAPTGIVPTRKMSPRVPLQPDEIVKDVVAMANTNGGTIYVGVKADPKTPPVGVDDLEAAIAALKAEIQRKVTPPLEVEVTTVETQGRHVVQITVPLGEDVPYALDGTTIYLRQEAETNVAMRDEIVALIRRKIKAEPPPRLEPAPVEGAAAVPAGADPPGTGVQILETAERKGVQYHTMKDLRNSNVVRNVTRASARKLWRYAITEHETHAVDAGQVQWAVEDARLGLWKSSRREGKLRYDLVQRMPDGQLQVYYGVTEDGIGGAWRVFVKEEPAA